MLSLSRILPAGSGNGSGDAQATTGLKRRSSAYVSATSRGRNTFYDLHEEHIHETFFLPWKKI